MLRLEAMNLLDFAIPELSYVLPFQQLKPANVPLAWLFATADRRIFSPAH